MKTSDFSFELPKKLIAQKPANPRDHSRLLVIDRASGTLKHDYFYNLPRYLTANHVLVMNNSRIVPFRLHGKRIRKPMDPRGKTEEAKVEILLLKQIGAKRWEALARPLKKLQQGDTLVFGRHQEIIFNFEKRQREVAILSTKIHWIALKKKLEKIGEMPTPPYISKRLASKSQYQTMYAKIDGSAAAPTAGLHFTKRVFSELAKRHIGTIETTLHVGLGTFQPVAEKTLEKHRMHSERILLSEPSAKKLNSAKHKNKKIVACGTTSLRLLESLTDAKGKVHATPRAGQETSIFIRPGYRFKFTDALVTNFHLPESTLFVLVCAFAGEKLMKKAYKEAIKKRYRFFSFGDAMLIL